MYLFLKKDVLIKIKGVASVDGEKEVIELTTIGNFYKKSNNYYLIYDESEATGYEGMTTTLKVEGNDCVTMERAGKTRSQLIIEKGKRHLCHYDTGNGELMIGVSAKKINSMLNDDGGELYFNYSLDINSSLASENEVFIDVKECKS